MSLPRSDRTAARKRGADSTLAFVESPVQLLNVLEWAYQAAPAVPGPSSPAAPPSAQPSPEQGRADGGRDGEGAGAGEPGGARESREMRESRETPQEAEPSLETDLAGGVPGPRGPVPNLTIVVLSPHDPMTRGQLRRVAELARDEGVAVRWQEAREGPTAPLKTVGSLAGELRRARRVVIGDPFSRYVQLLLTLTKARNVVVVDDGTATMEFVSQLARGERFVRWHRKGAGGPRALLFAPFSRRARTRLTPGVPGGPARSGDVTHSGTASGTDAGEGSAGPRDGSGTNGGGTDGGDAASGVTGGGREPRRVEVFSSMPVGPSHAELAALGVTVTVNGFAWTRARFGPPRLTKGTDLVGTSLVETGVVDLERYLEAVAALASEHGATRYFAHRRENSEKLQRVTAATGLEIVRPDLPLELVARRGPIGRTILSFPSTVVHTLPLALAGTPVTVAVCEVQRAWLTEGASPRAEGFLSGVTGSARGVRRIGPPSVPEPPREAPQDPAPASSKAPAPQPASAPQPAPQPAPAAERGSGEAKGGGGSGAGGTGRGGSEPSVAATSPEAGTASA